MAGSSYNYDKSSNFFSTDDVDDATFLKGGHRAYESSTMDERRQQLLEEKRKIEERTIQSSYRSVSLLHESEQIGSATAEELARQREQLQSAEQKLDEINSTLRVSQRHIQGIKSVFGSIRNYFTAPKNDGSKMTSSSSANDLEQKQNAAGRSQLSQILESSSERGRNDIHPVDRLRSESVPSSQKVDDILDRNLELMGDSISKLKNLGLDLNTEIDNQNVMLDRLHTKTEDVDFRVQSQTKEMNRILKK